MIFVFTTFNAKQIGHRSMQPISFQQSRLKQVGWTSTSTWFQLITTKFWFIMATSRYNCAKVNQNSVGVEPKSAISVRLDPLCHGGALFWTVCLLKWAIRGESFRDSQLKKVAQCLCSLCHVCCSNACDILYPYRQIYWPYCWYEKLSKCNNFTYFIDSGRSTSEIWKVTHFVGTEPWPSAKINNKFTDS